MKRKSEEYFKNISKEEPLKLFKDCDIEVEEVPEGEGGFFIDGERIEI